MDTTNFTKAITAVVKAGLRRVGLSAEVGGEWHWGSFKDGSWLPLLVSRSFRNYWASSSQEYFRAKYPGLTDDAIAKRLIAVAAKQAAALGAGTGAAMSANELTAIFTAGEGLIGLPANIALGAVTTCGESVVLVLVWLKLIAELGCLYKVELNADDPEDIWIIIWYALGGSAVQLAGEGGIKMAGLGGKAFVKRYLAKDALKAAKRLASKMGVKLLQRTVIKGVVPIISVPLGGGWNYLSTRAVGKIAQKQFKRRAEDQGDPPPDLAFAA